VIVIRVSQMFLFCKSKGSKNDIKAENKTLIQVSFIPYRILSKVYSHTCE
jgi:hypothetical protein